MPRKRRILIADDHAVFRHGLKDILARHFVGAVLAEAATGREAIEQIRKARWDIVVLDVTMPGLSGIDVLHEIRQFERSPPILVLSMHPEEQYALRTLRAGAVGYIAKLNAPRTIVDAVECVLAGGKYVSPDLATRSLAEERLGTRRTAHDRLSRREHQVMLLIASGQPLKAISHELGVCIQTVSTHRARVMKKLGLDTNADLIRFAVDNALLA